MKNATEMYTKFAEYVITNIPNTLIVFKWIVKIVEYTAPAFMFFANEIDEISQGEWNYKHSIILGIVISLIVILLLVIKSIINTMSMFCNFVLKYGLFLVIAIVIGYFVIEFGFDSK